MRRTASGRALFLGAALACSGTAAGCGGGDRPDEPAERQLTVLMAGAFDSIDPGMSVHVATRSALGAVHRSLYAFHAPSRLELRPDLALDPPQISDGGRTLTVRLRAGVRYSPPVNRTVRSGDVRYAIERLFTKPVGLLLARELYGEIVGADAFAAGRARAISGIETPNDRTIVFRLNEPVAASFAFDLAGPQSAPVPPEYARRFDRGARSTYGAHQVATGPYRFAAARDGTVTKRGFDPLTGARLVRNPNWVAGTDRRPAPSDEIRFRFGNDDAQIATERILRGRRLAGAGFQVPADVIRSIPGQRRERVLSPGVRDRITYLTLNTSLPPFDDVDVRQAVTAGLDRRHLLQVEGGALSGDVAGHLIPPDAVGFDASGGLHGAATPQLAEPAGDAALAARHMRRAGFASGRYEGGGEVRLVVPATLRGGEAVQAELERLGFDVRLRKVPPDVVTQECGERRREVHACVTGFSMGADPGIFLDSVFGAAAVNSGVTFNFSRFTEARAERAIRRARATIAPDARARAFAVANRAILEQAPAIPLAWSRRLVPHSSDVRGGALYDLDYAFASVE